MPSSNVLSSPNSAADITLGIILTLCIAIGLPANIVAFTHFVQKKSRNPNSCFFTQMYCVISFIDCLISVKHFPVIQSLFNKRGSSDPPSKLLFHDHYFCSIWFMVTMCTIMVSVFCILMLALSRYILIKYPQYKLSLKWLSPWVPPLLWALIIVVVICGLVAVDYVAIFYNKDKGVCAMYGSEPDFDFKNITNESTLSKRMMKRDMTKKIALSCALAAPMPFIMICVVLSLRHLKMARVRALNTRGGHKAHSKASTTVIIFTLVYIVCNFPMLGYLGYLKYLISNTISDWDQWYKDSDVKPAYVNETSGVGYYYMLYYDHLYNEVYSSFERYYAWIAVFDVPTAVNSMINPIIYYWRMKSFRDFVHSGIHEMTSSHDDDPTKSRINESSMPRTTATAATPKLTVNTIWKGVQSIGTPNSCRGMGPDTANRPTRKRDISLERSDDIVGDSSGNV